MRFVFSLDILVLSSASNTLVNHCKTLDTGLWLGLVEHGHASHLSASAYFSFEKREAAVIAAHQYRSVLMDQHNPRSSQYRQRSAASRPRGLASYHIVKMMSMSLSSIGYRGPTPHRDMSAVLTGAISCAYRPGYDMRIKRSHVLSRT